MYGDRSSNLASKYAIFAAAFVARADEEEDISDVDANDNSFEQPADDETMNNESDDEDVFQEYLAGEDELKKSKQSILMVTKKEASGWFLMPFSSFTSMGKRGKMRSSGNVRIGSNVQL